MNTEKYHQLLSHQAILPGKCLIGDSFIFQHGNDPKHNINGVKVYLDRKIHNGTQSVMDWPPQSPDLNIVEAV